MPECDSALYSTEYEGSDSTSRTSFSGGNIPGSISLESSLDGVTCAHFADVTSHIDSVVQAKYTTESGDSGNLDSIKLTSELTFNGLQVSANAGTGGVGGSVTVSGNTVTYNGKFTENIEPKYVGLDIEGTALAATSVVQRDTATFRINGDPYSIDTVIDKNLSTI